MNEKPVSVTWNSPAVFPDNSRPILLTVATLMADGTTAERGRQVYRGVYARPRSVELDPESYTGDTDMVEEVVEESGGPELYLKRGYYAEGPDGYWPVDGGYTRLCGWAEMVEPMGVEG